jgi:hypothetical protein
MTVIKGEGWNDGDKKIVPSFQNRACETFWNPGFWLGCGWIPTFAAQRLE